MNLYTNTKIGILEVITGSMFSGKSEELIRRLRRSQYAKQNVVIFNHAIDKRYDDLAIVSHGKNKIEAYPAASAKEMDEYLEDIPGVDVIGIDEAQFFDNEIVTLCKKYLNLGKRIIIAGLDMDFRGVPFNPMPELMAIADYVDKFHAICTVCGNPAYLSQRIIDGEPAYFEDPIVMVGATESYEARCRRHHIVKHKNEDNNKIYFLIGTDMNIGKQDVRKMYIEKNFTEKTHSSIDINTIKFENICIKDIRKQIKEKTDANEIVFINVIGSILLPIDVNYTILDLIIELQHNSKVVLVSENKKGVLHQVLPTIDILKRSSIDIKEIVYVDKNNVNERIELFEKIKKLTNVNYVIL